jgi:hypothetical protein
VDEKTRKRAQEYFASLTEQASAVEGVQKTKYWIGLAKALGGALGTGLAGAGVYASLLAIPPAALIALAGVAVAITGGREYLDSSAQLEKVQKDLSAFDAESRQWDDPLPKIADQRRLAGSKGFQYAFGNDLKGKVVHPDEVRALWRQECKQLLQNHGALTQVMDEDLLGEKRLSYAWENQPVEALEVQGRRISGALIEAMTLKYRELREKYQQYQAHMEGELNALEAEKQRLHAEVSRASRRWLAPAQSMHDLGMREAKLLYDRALEPYLQEKQRALRELEASFCSTPGKLEFMHTQEVASIEDRFRNHPAVLAIKHAYQRDRDMCDFLYSQTKLLVDSFFDSQVRVIDSEIKQNKHLVRTEWNYGMQHLSGILDRILSARAEGEVQNIGISAPQMGRSWRISTYCREPSWQEIYGRQPQFQAQFAARITQDAWNLFWGNEGLGRYAAEPIDCWERLSSSCSAYPHRERVFNLHRLPVCSVVRGMFSQPVCVPPPACH